jgi:hypothetical protein
MNESNDKNKTEAPKENTEVVIESEQVSNYMEMTMKKKTHTSRPRRKQK